MTLSDWALRRPILPLVAIALLTILGLRAAGQMPLTHLPDLGQNRIVLRLVAEDATLAAMDRDLAQPLERALAALPQVGAISSEITATDLRVTLNLRDAGLAQDTLAAVSDRINALAPTSAIAFRIADIRARASRELALLELAVIPGDGDLVRASRTVETTILPALREIEGLTDITLRGLRRDRLTIRPDAAALAAADLTLADLSRQITDRLGRIAPADLPSGAEPGPALLGLSPLADDGDPVAALGRLPQVTGAGHVLPLATLARIETGPASTGTGTGMDAEQDWIVRHDGASAIFLRIDVDQSADLAGVLEALDTRIARLDARLAAEGQGLQLALVNRPADRAVAALGSTRRALLEGGLLVIAVIALALRARRATLLAALALPLSVLPTLFVMQALGISLNIVSLLALTLASGILVDDAIVEIENIHKHLAQGRNPRQAVAKAMRDIAGPVVATSAAILAIFAPLAGMPGEAGRYFWAFGATLCIATVISLAVSRLVIPPLAARFPDRLAPADIVPKPPGRALRAYDRLLGHVLAHRWLCLAAASAIAVLSVGAALTHPGSFIPLDPPRHLQVDLSLPPHLSPDARDRLTNRLAGDIAAVQGVSAVTTLISTDAGGLTRLSIATDGAPDTARAIRARLDAEPDARAIVLTAAGRAPLVIDLAARDLATLETGAAVLSGLLADPALAGAPRVITSAPAPELRFTPDPAVLRQLGLAQDDLALALRSLTVAPAQPLGRIDLQDGRDLAVHLDPISPASATDPDPLGASGRDLAFTALRLPSGQTVPLAALGRFDLHLTEASLSRRDGHYLRRLSIDPADPADTRDITRLVRLAVADLARDLPGLAILPDGDTRLRADMMADLRGAMGNMLLLFVAVLFLLFRAAGQVVVILISLLFSLCGGMLVLIATGLPISLPVMIGMLLLFGIVAKNGILLIDRAQRLHEQGAAMDMALRAAALDRARPILMTSAAMIAGMVPAALPGLDGAAFRQPLALTVIAGVAVSTFLSLLLVPALSLSAHRLGTRLGAIAASLGKDRAPAAATD